MQLPVACARTVVGTHVCMRTCVYMCTCACMCRCAADCAHMTAGKARARQRHCGTFRPAAGMVWPVEAPHLQHGVASQFTHGRSWVAGQPVPAPGGGKASHLAPPMAMSLPMSMQSLSCEAGSAGQAEACPSRAGAAVHPFTSGASRHACQSHGFIEASNNVM